MAARQTAARLQLVHERFKRIVNVTAHQHPKGGNFIRLNGFKYEDFSRAGIPNIARVNHLLNMNRVTEWTGFDFSQLVVFIVGRRWTFHPDLYRRAAIDFPMTLRWAVINVGRTSIDIRQTLYEDVAVNETTSSGSSSDAPPLPLADSVGRIVSVDPATLKPSPLPPAVFESLSAAKATDEGGPQLYEPIRPPPVVPFNVFTSRVHVRYDDMDMILHTTQGSYLDFALECAAQAAESGFYSKIREDVAFLRMKTFAANYMNVSQAGDELDVSTWEEADNPMMLNFVIRKQGQVIHYVQLEYFDDSDIFS